MGSFKGVGIFVFQYFCGGKCLCKYKFYVCVQREEREEIEEEYEQ